MVVTGASDGIGKEYSLQLARRGFNVLLVSRTQSKLDALAEEIENSYPDIKTKTFAMDFSENKDTDYANLKSLVHSLDVAILVNNVGQSHSIPVPFIETSHAEMMSIITVNCIGTVRVTEAVAPGMVARKRGLILTMASFGGVFPTPLLATYSGSKAFLQAWGTALGGELSQQGVHVQVVQSHLVTSAMSKIRRTSLLVPSPKGFVQSALAKIGRSGGSQGIPYTSTPWWTHGIMQWAINTFAGNSHITLAINRSMHEGIRKRALAKASRARKAE